MCIMVNVMNEQEKFEKAQKLSQKSGTSFEEAKQALENSNWDMLDAMIYLEKNGKVNQGKNVNEQCFNAGQNESAGEHKVYESQTSKSFGETIGKMLGWFGDLIKKGMDNYFVIRKDASDPVRIPITIFVLLLIIFNGISLLLLIIGLFCGLRYSFEGQGVSNMNADKVNDALNSATDKATQFTNDVKDGYRNHKE